MDCPKCDAVDYGFEMSDVRFSAFHSECGEDCDCEEQEQECESVKVTVVIDRVWDQECSYCGGVDWRASWLVKVDGKTVATVPSEDAALAVVESDYPCKEERDYAWESEAGLRRAEGWGC